MIRVAAVTLAGLFLLAGVLPPGASADAPPDLRVDLHYRKANAHAGGPPSIPPSSSRSPDRIVAHQPPPRSSQAVSAPLLVAAGSLGPPQIQSSAGHPGLDDLLDPSVSVNCSVRPCIEPPDPWIAVGPNHVVQLVNGWVRISDRNGNALLNELSAQLFQSSNPWPFDGRVLWDAPHSRWLAIAASTDGCGNGFLNVAVSNGGNPTGSWHRYELRFDGRLMDFPGIGVSGDKVVLSANEYRFGVGGCGVVSGYLGASLLVMDWTQLLSGPSQLDIAETSPSSSLFTWRPAVNVSTTNTVRAVVEIVPASGPFHVGYSEITGLVAAQNIAISTPKDLTAAGKAAAFVDPPNPRQPGTPNVATTALDSRPLDAKWYAGGLWFVATQRCRPAGDTADRACVRATQYRPGTDTMADDFLVSKAGAHSYVPGLGIAGNGRIFVVFSRSSGSQKIATYVVSRGPSDPANAVTDAAQLTVGTTTYPGTRWGDYVGISSDPMSSSTVWVADEHPSTDGGWMTWVQKLAWHAGSLTGSVQINDGALYSQVPQVTIKITVPGSAPATLVRLSDSPTLSGGVLAKGATFPVQPTIDWSLSNPDWGGSLTNGNRRVYAQFGNGASGWSATVNDLIMFDNTAPVLDEWAVSFRTGQTAAPDLWPVTLTWTSSDAHSGMQGQRIYDHYYPDGHWVSGGGALSWDTGFWWADTIDFELWDNAGNYGNGGGYVTTGTPAFSNFVFVQPGDWLDGTISGGFNGSSKYSTVAGATASLTFYDQRVAIVSVVGPHRGEARVYIDGVLDATVDLYAAIVTPAQVVWAHSWPTTGSHTVKIEVVGTVGRPRVDIEAVAVS